MRSDDSYIRTVITSPHTTLFLNPVVRWNRHGAAPRPRRHRVTVSDVDAARRSGSGCCRSVLDVQAKPGALPRRTWSALAVERAVIVWSFGASVVRRRRSRTGAGRQSSFRVVHHSIPLR